MNATQRKENTRVVQFRAPSEYLNMIDIITLAINKKIKAVGSTDFYNVTDVMKLSIEALSTGKNTINILNKEFSISELVDEELARFNSNNYKEEIYPIILLTFRKHLFNELREIEFEVNLTKAENRDYQGDKYLEEISGLLAIWGTDVNSIVVETAISEIDEMCKKVEFNLGDSSEMEKSLEDELMENEYFDLFQGLKLKSHYQYSLILTYVREEISKLVAKIQSTSERFDNNGEFEDPFK